MQKLSVEEPEPVTFKVMSYNILAERQLHRRATHLADDSMSRDSIYRRNRILQEIENSNADIICLQEVAYTDGAYKFFNRELTSLGYKVVLEPTSEDLMLHKIDKPSQEALTQLSRSFGIMTAYKEDLFTIK